jgi:hypothetical protein
VQLLVTTDSSNYNLVLGPENNLTAHAPDADDDVDVPTVPFGINTGLRYAWNGSLTLNGYYDANRINSTSWIRLSDSDQSSPSKFLNDGLYRFRATVRSKEQEQGRDLEAVLSLNETSISLPPNFVCENVTIEPSQESTFPIRIPDYLLDSADRCVVRNESSPPDDVDTIVLGVPFWQAAYVYATRNEADGSSAEVYLAQANDYNLTSKPERFDAQQTLTPPSKPEGYKEPTSDGVVVRSSIACTLVILFTCALVFL